MKKNSQNSVFKGGFPSGFTAAAAAANTMAADTCGAPRASETTDTERSFCYMLANALLDTTVTTFIGESADPVGSLGDHNAGCAPESEITRDARGYWYLEMFVGPFADHDEAVSFASRWKKGGRGIARRRQCGLELAAECRKDCCDLSIGRSPEMIAACTFGVRRTGAECW